MKIVKPWAKINEYKNLKSGIRALRKIERKARISHDSEDKQTADSWRRFIETVVVDRGDLSVIEHVSVTVDFYTDRGVGEEQVRHRLFSFTKESTRFVNYLKKMKFNVIYPRPDEKKIHPSWQTAIETCEECYINLLRDGWSPQEARSVLPLAFAAKTAVSGNLRNWRHLFLMRTTKETHPQYRNIMIPLMKKFQEIFPIIFDDIEPMAPQRENVRKPR